MASEFLLSLLAIATCLASLASAISSNFARNVTLSMTFLAATARILRQFLPTTRLMVLDKVLSETEHTLHDYVEKGVLPLEFRADVSFMKLRLKASSLREETLRTDSSLWKECRACCTGLSLAIFRCQRATQALQVRILIAIESHQQIILKESIEHQGNASPLSISSGIRVNGVGVHNDHEITIPAPCVIAGSYRLRQPPPPPNEVTPETIMINVLNSLNSS